MALIALIAAAMTELLERTGNGVEVKVSWGLRVRNYSTRPVSGMVTWPVNDYPSFLFSVLVVIHGIDSDIVDSDINYSGS